MDIIDIENDDIYSETNEYWAEEFNNEPITTEDLDRIYNYLYQ